MSERGEGWIDETTLDTLLVVARAAQANAYVPYSGFPVGSAVLTTSGEIVPGANVENASYGLTVCGERAAVFRAVAEGHRELRAVVVSAQKAPGATPCGACRQVLNEFRPAGGEMAVVLDRGAASAPDIVPLSQLLPRAFGPHDL